jgi:hypothetical protein
MKQDFLQIRMSEDEKSELSEVVSKLLNQDVTVSQFVRDAIREKIAKAKRKLDADTAAGATA